MKSTSNKIDDIKKGNDKIVISSEYYKNDRPSYICSFCNMTLSRLSDESKITIPDRNIEPAIASIGFTPDVSIRHTPETKGAFKGLQQKGIRITDYKESVG